MLPEAFEGFGPFMKRADCLGVGAIEHVAAIAANVNQANVAQHPEVLGDRRLTETQVGNDFADFALLQGEVVQDVPAARFGDGVEGVGGG